MTPLELLLAGALLVAGAPPTTADLTRTVEEAMRSWRVPGVAVAIVRDDKVVYLQGHGVRAVVAKAPITPETLFPIASCTKAFTATTLATLVDEKKLDWDDPVRKHVSSFRLADPDANEKVTLRDLLCHRTGLRSHDFLWYHAPWRPEESVRRAGRLPLDQPFRAAFQYQSTMVAAAGLAAASASGKSWEASIRERLLDPLAIRGVFTTADAETIADRARPHRLNGFGQPESTADYRIEFPDPAGSMHLSARELARWLRFQLNGGRVGQRQLARSATLAETHKPQMLIAMDSVDHDLHPETKAMHYGLGWVLYDYRGRQVIGHAGAIDGYRAHLAFLPKEKIGIVVLANLHHTRMNLALCNALVDRLLGLPRKNWNDILQRVVTKAARDAEMKRQLREQDRRPDTRPSHALAAYAGTYTHPAYGDVRVRVDREGLLWTWNRFEARLEHYHDDSFVLPIEILSEPIVAFTLDKAGRVAALTVPGALGVEFRRASTK